MSLELDVDKGTLRFWLDGKPHGPVWFGGEKINGELRWAAINQNEGVSVEIMPTPELEPWKEWDFGRMGEERRLIYGHGVDCEANKYYMGPMDQLS